jgi:UDP-sugar pyrophosphorylase
MTHFELKNLSQHQQEWIERLKSDEYGQKKILDSIVSLEDLNGIIQQLEDISESYSAGVLGYIQNARNLFQSHSTNSKIVDDFHVKIPPTYRYEPASKEFLDMEIIGLNHLDSVVFVLVAGGLGERLGSTQPKVLLPIESITETSFLQFYIQLIQAWESYSKINLNVVTQIPLVIMTSEDTHQNTKIYLEEHNYFGLYREQIHFLKQNKVPAFSNSKGEFSIGRTEKGVLFIETKPHGHGDVHYLLWKSGLIKKWVQEGKKSLFLFQDTNALMFYALPLLLGVSFTYSLTMNFLAISRKSGEAVGAMCELVPKNNTIFSGSSKIVNIEYNQFEKLYDTSGISFDAIHPLTGNSVFPGNANVLLFNLKRYGDILEKTTGIVPEFINPKYINEKTNEFLTSGRLECLMQDFSYLLEQTDKVIFFLNNFFI